jgi:hypothetical protein
MYFLGDLEMLSTTVPEKEKVSLDTAWKIVFVAAFGWFFVVALYIALGLDWLAQTDAVMFWASSQNLGDFSGFIMPAYPVMLFLLSQVFPFVPPVIYMQAICLVAYLISVYVVYVILHELKISIAWQGALVFAFFPLIGLTYTVAPRVNALSNLFMVLAILFYLRNQPTGLIISLALLLLLHKSAWVSVGLIVLIGLVERKIKLWMLVPIALPLIIYWLMGVAHYGELTWIIDMNVSEQVNSTSTLPFMDGLLGSYVAGLAGSLPDLIKGMLVSMWFGLALFLLATGIWRRQLILLSVILPIIFWSLVLNNYQILSTLVYTSFIAIPMAVYLHEKGFDWLKKTNLWIGILALCLLSQVGFAVYAAKYFF